MPFNFGWDVGGLPMVCQRLFALGFAGSTLVLIFAKPT
jgi:hypothetical protein